MFSRTVYTCIPRALVAIAAALVMGACGSEGVAPAAVTGPTAAAAGPETGTFTSSAGVAVASCDVFGVPYTLTLSGSSHLSTTGSEVLICRGSIAETPPAQGEVLHGFSCYLPQTMDYTTISQLVVNPQGGAVLRCQGR
jgi:hypothetical protein